MLYCKYMDPVCTFVILHVFFLIGIVIGIILMTMRDHIYSRTGLVTFGWVKLGFSQFSWLAMVFIGEREREREKLWCRYAAANKKSYSHPLQLSICLSQLYGCIVYFITPVLDNVEYAVGPFYFWFYYIFMNNIWVVIPSIIALRSWRQIVQAFQVKSKKKWKERNLNLD